MDSSPVTTKITPTTFRRTLQEAYPYGLFIHPRNEEIWSVSAPGRNGLGKGKLRSAKGAPQEEEELLKKGPSDCHHDSTSSSPPLNLDAWSLHFLEKPIPEANLGDWSVPEGVLVAFTDNDNAVEFEAKYDLIEKNPRGSINPNNVHPMVTRSKSGALKYKAKEASPCISESSSEQTSTPSAAERTSKKATPGNSECTPKEAFPGHVNSVI